MKHKSTVYIVDDDPAVRDALSLLIEQGGYAVQPFDSAEDFLADCTNERQRRGCIVLDVRMPGMDGLRLQQELSKLGVRWPVIFLTGHGDIPMSVRAMKSGAVDFLTKPVTGAALLDSVRSALQVGDKRRRQAEASKSAAGRLAKLTEREREVMGLAVGGHTNKEIARRLGISHRTVEIHKARILRKTGAMTVVDLARIAAASQVPA